jgi:DNA-binding HxlR family transcriptional regulator
MTINQIIVLLDVFRGFNKLGHTNTLEGDLEFLEKEGFIYEDNMLYPERGSWSLTDKGNALAETIYAVVDWPNRTDRD